MQKEKTEMPEGEMDLAIRLNLKKRRIRPTKLGALKDRVYITPAAYKILRKEKRKQKKSMAEIASDLILKKYEKNG